METDNKRSEKETIHSKIIREAAGALLTGRRSRVSFSGTKEELKHVLIAVESACRLDKLLGDKDATLNEVTEAIVERNKTTGIVSALFGVKWPI
jgi:hypothetical protein